MFRLQLIESTIYGTTLQQDLLHLNVKWYKVTHREGWDTIYIQKWIFFFFVTRSLLTNNTCRVHRQFISSSSSSSSSSFLSPRSFLILHLPIWHQENYIYHLTTPPTMAHKPGQWLGWEGSLQQIECNMDCMMKKPYFWPIYRCCSHIWQTLVDLGLA